MLGVIVSVRCAVTLAWPHRCWHIRLYVYPLRRTMSLLADCRSELAIPDAASALGFTANRRLYRYGDGSARHHAQVYRARASHPRSAASSGCVGTSCTPSILDARRV